MILCRPRPTRTPRRRREDDERCVHSKCFTSYFQQEGCLTYNKGVHTAHNKLNILIHTLEKASEVMTVTYNKGVHTAHNKLNIFLIHTL